MKNTNLGFFTKITEDREKEALKHHVNYLESLQTDTRTVLALIELAMTLISTARGLSSGGLGLKSDEDSSGSTVSTDLIINNLSPWTIAITATQKIFSLDHESLIIPPNSSTTLSITYFCKKEQVIDNAPEIELLLINYDGRSLQFRFSIVNDFIPSDTGGWDGYVGPNDFTVIRPKPDNPEKNDSVSASYRLSFLVRNHYSTSFTAEHEDLFSFFIASTSSGADAGKVSLSIYELMEE